MSWKPSRIEIESGEERAKILSVAREFLGGADAGDGGRCGSRRAHTAAPRDLLRARVGMEEEGRAEDLLLGRGFM